MQNDVVVITLQREIHGKQMLLACRVSSFFSAELPEEGWD